MQWKVLKMLSIPSLYEMKRVRGGGGKLNMRAIKILSILVRDFAFQFQTDLRTVNGDKKILVLVEFTIPFFWRYYTQY